jgi:hypothetical protein
MLFIVTVKTSRIHVVADTAHEAVEKVSNDGHTGHTIVERKYSPNYTERVWSTVIK